MKAKRLILSWELLRGWFGTGEHVFSYAVRSGAIPNDAELVNVRHAWPNGVELLVRSESFEEIAEGAEIPAIELTFETVTAP